MRRIREFARGALEAATALYAVIALTLILRSVKAEAEDEDSEAISNYERGRRDERRVLLAEARVEEREEVWEARRDASTERAQGIARKHSPLSALEMLEARVGRLEARVRNSESENERWRKSTAEAVSGVGSLKARVEEQRRDFNEHRNVMHFGTGRAQEFEEMRRRVTALETASPPVEKLEAGRERRAELSRLDKMGDGWGNVVDEGED